VGDVVAVTAGSYHTLGVTAAGRAVAVGKDDSGRCDVADWREIVTVAAGSNHTLGLRAGGTVVAAGNNQHGQCDITGWDAIPTPK
jgi:alpha-tubulin suppressor-like RCC1 family protein